MLCSRGSHEGIRNDLDQSVNGATAQSPTAGQRLVFSPPLEGGGHCGAALLVVRKVRKQLRRGQVSRLWRHAWSAWRPVPRRTIGRAN
jgi:hypothetical protein